MTIAFFGILGLAVGAAVNFWSVRIQNGGEVGRGHVRCALAAMSLGLTYAALAARYGVGLELVELCGFSAVLLALSLTDIDAYRIPNSCIVCALAIRVAYLAACCVTSDLKVSDVCFYVLSALGVGVALAAIVLICDYMMGMESMGGGDLKLFVTAAAYVGWAQSIFLVLVACVLGIVSSPLFGKERRKASGTAKPFPFGPSIALACVITLLYGERLVSWYASLLQAAL